MTRRKFNPAVDVVPGYRVLPFPTLDGCTVFEHDACGRGRAYGAGGNATLLLFAKDHGPTCYAPRSVAGEPFTPALRCAAELADGGR